MINILCDIGGTHIRFARNQDHKPADIRKYKVDQFSALSEAVTEYCDEVFTGQDQMRQDPKGNIAIAAAGDGSIEKWVITNKPDWPVDVVKLQEQGWSVTTLMNDFEANAWSLPVLESADVKTLKDVPNPQPLSLCLIGPGTGLGLAYYHDKPVPHVQKTHGGHMPIVTVTEEQWQYVQGLQQTKNKTTPIVFEDVISGQNDILNMDLRLFHEFLGLFAAQSVIHGHAYGGLYLTGGAIQHFMDHDLFDLETFLRWFEIGGVDCVAKDLANTPVYYITDPIPALKGLIHVQRLPNN